MFIQILKKEFLEIIAGPKFLITFAICTILILTSLYSGYELYQTERSWYARAQAENARALSNAGTFSRLESMGTKTLREPSVIGIFVKGVDSSIGKASMVNDENNIVLRDSRFGLNPIFAVFGELDIAFIVKIILSLFALLFAYNAVSGERELGTLKQVMSYPISRAVFLAGKAIGGLLTLWTILLLPLLLGLIMLLFLPDIRIGGNEWIRIASLAGVFCLFLAVFYMIGILMSALTRNSFVSFLLALFVWVISIVVLPKSAVELAGSFSPAPSIDTVEAEMATIQREYGKQLKRLAEKYFNEKFSREENNFSEAFRYAFDRSTKEAQEIVSKQQDPLYNRYRREQLNLLRTAENFSRVSPTACMTLAVNRLAGHDAALRDRFVNSLRTYKEAYLQFVDTLKDKNPEKAEGGISISHTSDGTMEVSVPDYDIDVSSLPEFRLNQESNEAAVSGILPDIGILSGYFVILFGAAFVAFAGYDVR